MLFNSLAFLLFFPVVFTIYWCIPNARVRIQNVLLLVASYVFYGWWDWRFLSLIAFSTSVDYLVGLQIAKNDDNRKKWLWVSVFVNLGLLATFKYFNFFLESWVELWNLFGINWNIGTLNIVLPVGISFYTFQTMSYSIDIYKKELKPTRDFIAFATFVSFFPQLVAGPIERASNLIPQLLAKRVWSHKNFKDGLFQITIGFFRKIVVADSIGALIDGVYNNPEIYNGSTLALAVFLYSFQIYFDFSGYSDIAIGTAKLLGFKFKRNFNIPYFSTSITEFWRRWHISLSTWLRDYLYIPLGGNRKGIVMQYRNLFLTMLLGGLWHGSSWNFVIWGGIHGCLLAIERRFNLMPKQYNLLNNLLNFTLVTLIWVFFRALNFSDAKIIFMKLFIGPYNELYIGDISLLFSTVYGLVIGVLFDFYLFKKEVFLEDLGHKIKNLFFVFFIGFIVLNIVLFYSSANNFIYFQF